MKIKFTFHWTEYPNSKFATFLSKLKGSFAGFLGWCAIWMLPFIITGAIASNYGNALIALIIVAICTLISYGLLFLIDQDKIAAKKSAKSASKIPQTIRDLQSTEAVAQNKSNNSVAVRVLRDKMCNYFLIITENFAHDLGKDSEFCIKKALIYGCIANTIDMAIEQNGSKFFDESDSEMLQKRNEVASKIFAIGYYFLNGFDLEIQMQIIPFEQRISTLSELLKESLGDKSVQFFNEDRLNTYLIDEISKRNNDQQTVAKE